MALEYLREYRTYFHIGQSYGISESSAYKSVRWIEDSLIKHPNFALSGKKALIKSDKKYELVLIDATESLIERPKKAEILYYSGKKKRHSLKTQLVVDKKTKKVVCTSFANGKRHDFRLFKESKIYILAEIKVIADTGIRVCKRFIKNLNCQRKRARRILEQKKIR